jgi:hypothetical protein
MSTGGQFGILERFPGFAFGNSRRLHQFYFANLKTQAQLAFQGLRLCLWSNFFSPVTDLGQENRVRSVSC